VHWHQATLSWQGDWTLSRSRAMTHLSDFQADSGFGEGPRRVGCAILWQFPGDSPGIHGPPGVGPRVVSPGLLMQIPFSDPGFDTESLR
jgi:hypothetical protein